MTTQIDVSQLERQCGTKARYSTEALAKQVATDCWYQRKINLRVYACAVCGGFHLTRVAAAQVMRPGWRLPKKSERAKAQDRKRRRRK